MSITIQTVNKHGSIPDKMRVDKTNKKRVTYFKEYLKWLKINEIFNVAENIIKTSIVSSDYKPTKVTLELDELEHLRDYEFDNEKYRKVRDAFIFMCATSFRYGDLITFSKAHVNGKYIVKTAVKTIKNKAEYTIPITTTIEKLMKKYNYNFKFYTQQPFNRYLKDLLREYSEDTGRLKDVVRIKNIILGKETWEEKKKWDCISSHTGRRTFITLAIEKPISHNKIINMTAHLRVTTLNQYINPNTRPPEPEEISFV